MFLSYPDRICQPGMPASQVLAIGDFDGVHLGHQEVISRAIRTARQAEIPAAIMTFHPHPRTVLGHSKYVQLLTPLADKLEMFRRLGADYAYVVTFDAQFARVSPDEFLEKVLVPLGTETVVVGFDFTFGHLGKGTADSLCLLGKGRFAVEVVRPFHLDGQKVSSTSIRGYLQSGELDLADRMLGRPYAMKGHVVRGDGRGRTIGFPTANIECRDPYVCPREGVYAVQVEWRDTVYNGVMNIGRKPTFTDEGQQTMEAHLFDFSGSLYGEEVVVRFLHYIREERKFTSARELVEQIRLDVLTARDKLPV